MEGFPAHSTRTAAGAGPSVRSLLDSRELVPQLLLLRLEVAAGVIGRRDLERQPFDDGELVALDADQLARIVRQQAHRTDPEILQDLDADAVVALIGLETEPLVRLDGVESLILQLVGANLVGQPDSPPLLVEI